MDDNEDENNDDEEDEDYYYASDNENEDDDDEIDDMNMMRLIWNKLYKDKHEPKPTTVEEPNDEQMDEQNENNPNKEEEEEIEIEFQEDGEEDEPLFKNYDEEPKEMETRWSTQEICALE